MCVFSCYQCLSAGTRLRQVSFHIPCRQSGHPAQHCHCRREICTVSFPGLEQKHGHKIDVLRMFTDIQGITAVVPQPVLNCGCLFIRVADPCSDLPGQVVYGLFQMIRKCRIDLRNIFPPRIALRSAEIQQGSDSCIVGGKQWCPDCIRIPVLKIPRNENFGCIGKIRNQIRSGNQFPDPLRYKKRGGAFIQQTNTDRFRSAQ